MKMYEEIKKELSFGTVKVWNSDVSDRTNNKGLLEITELDVLEALKSHEVDFEEIIQSELEYYLEETESNLEDDELDKEIRQELESEEKDLRYALENIPSLDDYIYEGNEIINIDYHEKSIQNTCNWSSQVTMVFSEIEINSHEFMLVKFHRYGDVRGNYTSYMLLDLNIDQLYDSIKECDEYHFVDVDGSNWSVSTSVFNESRCYDLDSEDLNIQLYDVYIDNLDDSTEDKLQKTLREYLIEKDII